MVVSCNTRLNSVEAPCGYAAVQGATAHFVDIDVGISYNDPGMRVDCHDAVGVVITLPEVPQPSVTNTRSEDERPDAEKEEQKMTESQAERSESRAGIWLQQYAGVLRTPRTTRETLRRTRNGAACVTRMSRKGTST